MDKSRETRVKSRKSEGRAQRTSVAGGFAPRLNSGSRLSTLDSRLAGRRAITLTEVLISMGILTLGLLGVASLFPVGGHYMQQADISDNGAMIGRSIMNDLQAKGILNPKAWYSFVPPTNAS